MRGQGGFVLGVLLLVLAGGAAAAAEEHWIPLNLDFSRPSLVDPEGPWGWFLLPMASAGIETEWIDDPELYRKVLRLRRSQDGADARAVYFFSLDLGAGRRLGLEGGLRRPAGSAARVRLGLTAFSDDALVGEAWSEVLCRSGGEEPSDPEASCRLELALPAAIRHIQVQVEYAGTGARGAAPRPRSGRSSTPGWSGNRP